MPQRPREHVLETENEHAFRGAVPAEWVVRPINPDYGIDLNVEIFEGGASTAMSFGVQLKATDRENLRKALRDVRFPREVAEYYWQQPVPILIVRYHAPSGQLYARWWHAYNPLVAARPDEDAAGGSALSKTLGFVFTERDCWTAKTPDELVEGVRSFNRFHSPHLPLPVTFRVSGSDGADPAKVRRELTALRSLMGPLAGFVAVVDGTPGPDTPSIVIERQSATVALADVASITLDLSGEAVTPAQAAADLGCGIAMVLNTVGQPNLAAQVAAICVPGSTVICGMHVAWTLAGAFFRSGRIHDVLGVIEQLHAREDEDARLAAFVLQSAVLARGGSLTPEQQARAVEVATSTFEIARRGEDHQFAAICAYNLGRARADLGDWSGAVAAFGQAVELDANYGSDMYFVLDYAVSLFESGRSNEAIVLAKMAVDAEPSGKAQVLLADALMSSGRYAEAERALSTYLAGSSAGPADAAWRLRRRVLTELRSLVGDEQHRQPDEAEALAQGIPPFDENLDAEQARGDVTHALQLDAMCGEAHHYRTLLSAKEGEAGQLDLSDAIGPAICAAVLSPSEVVCWVMAVGIAIEYGEHANTISDLMHCGIFKTGDEFVNALLASEPPLTSEHGALLDQAVQDVAEQRRRGGFRMRIRDPGGLVDELIFSLDDPDVRDAGAQLPPEV